MFKIQALNNIAVAGLNRFPRDRYEIASEMAHPHAILVRSFDMHGMAVPETVMAVGRAGAGVNNIPVSEMSRRGIPVFNAPGANANAVKELVLAGMLLACRNVCQARDFVQRLGGDDQLLHKEVERGKKQFRGFELPGRTLGVVGLGAIGVEVANVAQALGMHVVGYDSTMTVERAWQLSSSVRQASSLDDLLLRSDFVTFHVPLTEDTRGMINASRLQAMKTGVVILNFARDGIIDNEALLAAVEQGKVYSYVCDFPVNALRGHDRVIALPHLGASTAEAEDNCAVMVADEIRDYLEHGTIRNSVNFPDVSLPQTEGFRLVIVNANVPNMVGQISTDLAKAGLNIVDMLNRSRGELAYTLVDVEDRVPEETLRAIAAIDGVLAVRTLY